MALKLTFDIVATNWQNARAHANATIAKFIGDSDIYENDRRYDTFNTDTIDTTPLVGPRTSVPTAFTTTVTVEFGGA